MARSKPEPLPVEPENEVPTEFSTPGSSSVIAATYDPQTRQMCVIFKGGAVYVYEGIEPHLWREFVEAESKGHFFSARVRPFIAGRKR